MASPPPPDQLADGRWVCIDYLGPADRADLLAGFENLSERSRYLRFFTPMPRLANAVLTRLLATDGGDHVALAARLCDERGTLLAPIVGVARYVRSANDPARAESAVAVIDALHGLGLGRLLLRRLVCEARGSGVDRFRAHVLTDNDHMRALLTSPHSSVVHRDGALLIYETDLRPV
jgi:GNAT superfamily N-acetyltransferase